MESNFSFLPTKHTKSDHIMTVVYSNNTLTIYPSISGAIYGFLTGIAVVKALTAAGIGRI